MNGTNKTIQREGRMENYMVGMKITLPVDGLRKNNSPKGWTVNPILDGGATLLFFKTVQELFGVEG